MDKYENLHLLSLSETVELMKLLHESRKVVVCAHRSPDGDAMGSSLAWAAYMRTLGKMVSVVLPNPCPDFLQWLPEAKRVTYYSNNTARAKQLIDDADLICCLDFNTLSRLEEMGECVKASAAKRLLIDHHLAPGTENFDLTVSHPELSSTSEIVFRLLLQLGAYDEITQDIATDIYCGLMTDTGNLAFSSSYPEIYEVIALLVRKNIDKDRIYRNVYHSFSAWRLKLQGYVLYEKVQWLAEGRAAYYTLTREEMKQLHFIRGDGEGLVNLPLQVKGTRLSISLREDTERDIVRVSLRSVDDFPCNRMAEEFFNGGGHLNASGGELPFPIEDAVHTVERAVEAYRELL